MAPVRILYIGGTGRTGSTVLEKLLGQLDGVFACGEMAYLWHALRVGGRCSCGEPLRACPTWTQIFVEAFGGASGVQEDRMFDLRQGFRSVHLPLMPFRPLRERAMERMRPFPERLATLYRAISTVTGARLLIDSSKEPHYSSILRSRPELDVRFAHLVRDPRAVAHSWRRTRAEPALGRGAQMERRGPMLSAAFYDISNAAAELLWAPKGESKYRRIRYEDLVRRPSEVFDVLSALSGVPLDPSCVLDGDTASVRATHSVWGNPNRFEVGRLRIAADEEWQQSMSGPRYWTSTLLTSPFVHRYGYPWRART